MRGGIATQVVRGVHESSRWELASRALPAALRGYVRSVVGYEESAVAPVIQRQFPATFVVVIIELGPPLCVTRGGDPRRAARSPGGFVAGLGESFADTAHAGGQRGVQVDLTPTGARRLFAMPLSELSDHIVALADLMPRAHAELRERLVGTADWSERLDHVDRFLERRILSAEVETSRVDWALARISESGGALEVGALSRELGMSHKHLIALFRDQVGVAPKLMARLSRFQRVMSRVRSQESVSWAELALDCGYSDQGHLAREVKHFTGLTPTTARAQLKALADLLG